MIRSLLLAIFFIVVTPVCATPSAPPSAKRLFAKWAGVKNVYAGDADPLGGYDAGCLQGATKIDLDGRGYAIMRPSRHRYYGHPDMDKFLHALGEKLQSEKLPLVLIGDVGLPRGGPMLSGHASHQVGLDADIWLIMGKKRPTKKDRERLSAPSFVSGRKKLKKSWSQTQVDLIRAAASFDSVVRIFVSPPMKRYFCEKMPDAEWLYKIRPWWGHEEHIHVRLNCPAGAAHCVAQNALDKTNNGCGPDLDWWFSKEADDKWTEMRMHPTPREFPTLPAECDKMVN